MFFLQISLSFSAVSPAILRLFSIQDMVEEIEKRVIGKNIFSVPSSAPEFPSYQGVFSDRSIFIGLNDMMMGTINGSLPDESVLLEIFNPEIDYESRILKLESVKYALTETLLLFKYDHILLRSNSCDKEKSSEEYILSTAVPDSSFTVKDILNHAHGREFESIVEYLKKGIRISELLIENKYQLEPFLPYSSLINQVSLLSQIEQSLEEIFDMPDLLIPLEVNEVKIDSSVNMRLLNKIRDKSHAIKILILDCTKSLGVTDPSVVAMWEVLTATKNPEGITIFGFPGINLAKLRSNRLQYLEISQVAGDQLNLLLSSLSYRFCKSVKWLKLDRIAGNTALNLDRFEVLEDLHISCSDDLGIDNILRNSITLERVELTDVKFSGFDLFKRGLITYTLYEGDGITSDIFIPQVDKLVIKYRLIDGIAKYVKFSDDIRSIEFEKAYYIGQEEILPIAWPRNLEEVEFNYLSDLLPYHPAILKLKYLKTIKFSDSSMDLKRVEEMFPGFECIREDCYVWNRI
jgi:hypothetical protein